MNRFILHLACAWVAITSIIIAVTLNDATAVLFAGLAIIGILYTQRRPR